VTSPREELHALVDKLDDDEIELCMMQVRDALTRRENRTSQKGWEAANKIRAKIAARFEDFPTGADIINEMNEERVDEIIAAIQGWPATPKLNNPE